MAVTACGKEL